MSNLPFAKMSSIQVDDPSSWQQKVFLTFDLDWASDAVIADTIELVENAAVEATWFITHDTPLIERLRRNPRFELGIHPNFNFLLEGDPRNGATADEVLSRLMSLIPEARAIRSHALAQGTALVKLFVGHGLTHDSNDLIPEGTGMELRPWRWFGLTKIPYFWEDDVHCLEQSGATMVELALRPGLTVFDFHPIHVFLNTEDLTRYDEARPHFADHRTLSARRFTTGVGTRDRLIELLSLAA